MLCQADLVSTPDERLWSGWEILVLVGNGGGGLEGGYPRVGAGRNGFPTTTCTYGGGPRSIVNVPWFIDESRADPTPT